MSKKKKVAYISTPKCANMSIRTALTSIDDMLPFDNHPAHHLRRYRLEIREDEILKYCDGDITVYHQKLNDTINDGAVCVVPFVKYPFHSAMMADKEAGTAMPHALQEYDGQIEPLFKRWTLVEKNLSKIFTDEFYTWTVVRNPWDRMASAYFHCQRDVDDAGNRRLSRLAQISFNDFVKNATDPLGWFKTVCEHTPDEILENTQLTSAIRHDVLRVLTGCTGLTYNGRQFSSFLHLFPTQWLMHVCNRAILIHTQRWEDSQLFTGWNSFDIESEDDEVIVSSINRMSGSPEPIDKVIRFENLQEGFDEVMEELDRPSMKLPMLNVNVSGQREKYADLYDDETIEMVRNWYKYEINEFGYEFGE